MYRENPHDLFVLLQAVASDFTPQTQYTLSHFTWHICVITAFVSCNIANNMQYAIYMFRAVDKAHDMNQAVTVKPLSKTLNCSEMLHHGRPLSSNTFLTSEGM